MKNASKTEFEKKYIDNHLYLDIEYNENPRRDIEISIASVLWKVIICDDFDEFVECITCKFKDFGNVFYGQYSFTFENYSKYNSSPFELINMKQFKKKLIEMSKKSEIEFNKRHETKKKIKYGHKMSMDKVNRYFIDHYKYYDGDDEVECMDSNIPFNLDNKNNDKKLLLEIGRQLIVNEVDIDNWPSYVAQRMLMLMALIHNYDFY